MARITKLQIRKLRTLAQARFGACDCPKPGATERPRCDYHQWLQGELSVSSTLQLSAHDAARAIDALEGKAVRPARTRQPAPWRGRYPVPGAKGMITQAQADAIAKIEEDLGWTDPAHLQGMIRRQLGRPANVTTPLHTLANRQASSLITGLSRLLDHVRAQA